ncbi:hypothetical protein CCR75_005304 [Bremia lactucae]|uniref:Uncharacterized protein n=1 Tax=Bremia lactucae TaxID=4779 RepID=A0A976IGW0_BRELC|nr:hypothetical protein CCR75_005304 [Bremia lactucae]
MKKGLLKKFSYATLASTFTKRKQILYLDRISQREMKKWDLHHRLLMNRKTAKTERGQESPETFPKLERDFSRRKWD